MKTLILPPNSEAYASTDEIENIYSPLDGGRGRYRKDLLSGSKLINAQWNLDMLRFDYFCAFYRYCMRNASEGFLLQLVVDQAVLTTHVCHFIPESFKILGQLGQTYNVGAQVEAKPLVYDPVADRDLVELFSSLDLDELIRLDDFDRIVNIDLQEDMAGAFSILP